MNQIVFEGMDELVELTNLNPVDAVDMIRQLRIRLTLMGDSRDVIPQLPRVVGEDDRKAAITGDQSQSFPAFDWWYLCHGTLLLIFLALAHRAADASLGAIQKGKHGHHIRLITEFRLCQSCCFGHTMAGSEKDVVGPFQHRHTIGGESMTPQSHGIQSIHARAVASGGTHERRKVLSQGTATADHRIGADTDVLVDAGQPTDYRMVANGDVSGQAGRIGHDQIVAQTAIVCHMAIGHEKVLVADRRHPAARLCPPIDGHVLPEHVVVSYDHLCRLPLVAEVLGRATDRHKRIQFASFADTRPAFDRHVREQPRPLPNRDVLSHHAKRPYRYVGGELRLRMDNRMWINLHAEPPVNVVRQSWSNLARAHSSRFTPFMSSLFPLSPWP